MDEVRDKAFAKGVVTIKEIELDDGIWEDEGRDAGGHEIKIEVDAGSGEIVKIKRR
ncbi:MAG: PepSY domain-containing protein [Methyloceanibacter sp.]